MSYGPFIDACDPALRSFYLAEMRPLCRVVAGPKAGEAVKVLCAALDAPDDSDRLAQARQAIDSLPAVPRRRVLASFTALRREAVDAS